MHLLKSLWAGKQCRLCLLRQWLIEMAFMQSAVIFVFFMFFLVYVSVFVFVLVFLSERLWAGRHCTLCLLQWWLSEMAFATKMPLLTSWLIAQLNWVVLSSIYLFGYCPPGLGGNGLRLVLQALLMVVTHPSGIHSHPRRTRRRLKSALSLLLTQSWLYGVSVF